MSNKGNGTKIDISSSCIIDMEKCSQWPWEVSSPLHKRSMNSGTRAFEYISISLVFSAKLGVMHIVENVCEFVTHTITRSLAEL